jgi:hypothetical protein
MDDSQFGYKQKFLKKENTVSVLGSRGGLNAVRKRLLRSSYCATARLVLNGSSALAQRERERERERVFHNPCRAGAILSSVLNSQSWDCSVVFLLRFKG